MAILSSWNIERVLWHRPLYSLPFCQILQYSTSLRQNQEDHQKPIFRKTNRILRFGIRAKLKDRQKFRMFPPGIDNINDE